MKPLFRNILVAVAAAGLLAGAAGAQSAVESAVKARQAHMQLQGFNMAPLAAMARGELPYDAEQAAALAGNLDALVNMDMAHYWPPGSAQGEIEDTRALPAIWENGSDIGAKVEAMRAAAGALNTAAGTDLAALQAAVGPVGQACGACHQSFRATE